MGRHAEGEPGDHEGASAGPGPLRRGPAARLAEEEGRVGEAAADVGEDAGDEGGVGRGEGGVDGGRGLRVEGGDCDDRCEDWLQQRAGQGQFVFSVPKVNGRTDVHARREGLRVDLGEGIFAP